MRACDCGAVEDVCIFVVDAGGQMVTAQARCCACGRRGPRVVCGLEVDARSSAIAGWNERPVEDALRAALVRARVWIGTRSTAIRFDHFADTETCIHCHMALDTIGGRERHASDCSRQKALAAIDAALEVNNG